MANKLRHVQIDSAKVKSVKADLVGGVVRVVLEMALLETLPLREDLSMMAFMSVPVEVEITQLQSEMELKLEQSQKVNRATGEIEDDDETA